MRKKKFKNCPCIYIYIYIYIYIDYQSQHSRVLNSQLYHFYALRTVECLRDRMCQSLFQSLTFFL